jgi:hypothetical protein
MRLADAVSTLKEQASAYDRKRIHEADRFPKRLAKGIVGTFEIRQVAVSVPLLDPRALHGTRIGSLAPAVAARHARDTVNLDRLPSGVVAGLAGHTAS